MDAPALGAQRERVANRMISVNIRRIAFGPTEILRNIRFDMADHESLAILGPSGIGKTTMLRAIAGLVGDFDGEISGASGLAMVFQEPNLLRWRNAVENLTLTTSASPAEARDILAEVGLADKEAHFPGQLSLGQQRRLSLARAFVAKPTLLLLDEPFASLDEATAASMIALTARMLAGRRMACLMVTHAAEEAVALASRALLMAGKPGTIVGEYLIDERPEGHKAEAAQDLRKALTTIAG
jgi:sulfonate transport system ATP-binding protein